MCASSGTDRLVNGIDDILTIGLDDYLLVPVFIDSLLDYPGDCCQLCSGNGLCTLDMLKF